MKREASTMKAFAGLGLGTAPRLPVWSVQYQNSRLSERLWHKRRCWVWLSLGVVVGLVAISGFALPTTALAGEKDPSPIVTVLVYNYTQASIDILAGAEREAGRILGEAGLRPVWIDCLDRDSAADLQSCAKRAREPIDVVLRVLPGHIQGRLQDTLFGFAFPPALASVYYEYAGRLASSDTEISIMLGCAIAHEVGHLLLGPSSHSAGESCAESGDPKSSAGADGQTAFRVPTGETHSGRGAKANEPYQTGTPKEQRLATVDQQGRSLKSFRKELIAVSCDNHIVIEVDGADFQIRRLFFSQGFLA